MDDIPEAGCPVKTFRGAWLAGLLVLVLLSGCSGLVFQTIEATAPSATLAPILTRLEPTLTPTLYTGTCSYVWAERSLPEVNSRLNKAFRLADMARVEAEASAYGENCVDMGTNVVVQFTPLQTNFFITLQVEDAEDTRVMGEWLVKILSVLGEFQPEELPGTRAGQVEVQFQDGSRGARLSFPLERGQELVRQGQQGSALFEQLEN
jgi:hypothetical protein